MKGLPAILEFVRFELKVRFRQPAVYLFSLLFGLLSFAAMTTDAVQIGGGGGQTLINAPYVVAQMLAIMSVFGILLVTAFAAGAVVRDFDDGAYQLFYTKPIHRRDYLLGRFVGGLLTAMFVMAACSLGMMIGSVMPWLDAERLGPFSLATFVQPLAVFVFPTLFVLGSIFFAVATFTRRMLWAYVAVAGLMVLFAVSEAFVGDLDNDTIAALIDPFGMSAFSIETRYWTPNERNTALVPFSGTVLLNRAIWSALGAAILAFTVVRYRMVAPSVGSKRGKAVENASNTEATIPKVALDYGALSQLRQWAFATRVEVRSVLTSTAFIVLCVFALINVLGGAHGTTNEMYGTPVLPVTNLMLRVIDGAMGLYLLIVITFYSGEVVWRERKNGMARVVDAMPTSNWVFSLSKLSALLAAVAVVCLVSVITAMLVQLLGGFTDLEIGLYARGVFGVQWSQWAVLVALAIFFQVITNHRFAGYGLMALHFIAQIALPLLDFEHRLYRFGSMGDGPYSDMNGFGHWIDPMLWFRGYWGFAALGLVLLANLMWVRGSDPRFKLRLREARYRMTPMYLALFAFAGAGFIASGAYVYYNTNVLNTYKPSKWSEDHVTEYEKKYKQYEDLPQPRVVATTLDAAIYPKERRVDLAGTITLENRTEGAIETLHVLLDSDTQWLSLSLDEFHELEHDDREIGYRIYRLSSPLRPGASMEVEFESRYEEPGFKNSGSNTDIVENGTFFHNDRYLPHFGYNPDFELGDPDERRKRGLPEKPRMLPVDDQEGLANTYISREADWIDFEATVSTSADQIALAPGYLTKEWTEGDRRFFHYEMDAPILNLYGFLSARYTVARDQWNDVAIEVYHHAPHDYNVPKMIEAVKKSLDYYTANFSPYQHRQVRIVEFPRYASYAQSLPNTIPYSESIGFIADLRDEEDIDYVFYVTAHEVAHQWWAHQVIGGNVQGSTVMSETLSQYSALMVMEKEYGRAKMKTFLRHELDRYLQGRATERKRELPLMLVENQPYIHYNKGSLVMYALREYIGEEALNRALSKYIEAVGFQRPPFTNSIEFVEFIRAETPPKYAYLIEDLFETITLYDNRMLSAKATESGGKWDVELEVMSKKFRASESGEETEVELDDWIELGLLDDEGEFLYREKHRLSDEKTTLTVTVDAKPAKAGIDPIVMLVDRNPDDNVKSVE
ncbi:MAG: M1 family aminopeptidase [Nannocystaceae bacterium]|nr:ABC transporter permease subunit [bacterium]